MGHISRGKKASVCVLMKCFSAANALLHTHVYAGIKNTHIHTFICDNHQKDIISSAGSDLRSHAKQTQWKAYLHS